MGKLVYGRNGGNLINTIMDDVSVEYIKDLVVNKKKTLSSKLDVTRSISWKKRA